ncbi:OmpA family protein [Alteribacter populi]|uniref:OmpA family protein n=1 Tax=Alteribacter populi TaxID=2011011 RepID=UPI000BBA4CF6|nr:OmpA family protein [Alteribacter populi]
MYYNPFRVRAPIGPPGERVEAESDGSFTIEFNHPNGDWRFIDVELEVVPLSQTTKLREVYGDRGEHLSGPLVYQVDTGGSTYSQKAMISQIIAYGESEEFEFDIVQTERKEVPDDYGDPEVWVETEFTNDHEYFYIKGESNLFEGMPIRAWYYESPDARLPQIIGPPYFTIVEPDGTFLLIVRYTGLSEEGFILVETDGYSRNMRTKSQEVYGGNFEKMSGEHVVKEDGRNNIQIKLYPDVPDVKAPEEVELSTDEDETKVQVPDDVLFEFDESDLKLEAENVLDEINNILEGLEDETEIKINGHTDNQGDPDYNLNLSEKRTQSVKDYLDENGDISNLVIETEGFGETKPLESNEDLDGQKRNRRVEIVVNTKED